MGNIDLADSGTAVMRRQVLIKPVLLMWNTCTCLKVRLFKVTLILSKLWHVHNRVTAKSNLHICCDTVTQVCLILVYT